MFSEYLQTLDWAEVTRQIYAKTDADVRRALSKPRCDVEDFMALISPAAAPYLETMARLSRRYTEERFGRVVSMFIPLYLTNSCTNSCVYCGFHVANKMKRTILTEEEIAQYLGNVDPSAFDRMGGRGMGGFGGMGGRQGMASSAETGTADFTLTRDHTGFTNIVAAQ